jgi:antitoxin ParD1/3/4
MSTATMNISLPDAMKKYVKERVDEERYSTPSDYVRSLIREDQQKLEDEERLEQMLLEGLRSGPGTTIRSKADWARFWKKIDADIKATHNKHNHD